MNIRLQSARALSNCTCFMGIPFPAASSDRRDGMNTATSLVLQVLPPQSATGQQSRWSASSARSRSPVQL